MEYYIYMWDMVSSTKAIHDDEKKTLEFINTVANFCLESTSELPQVQVVPIGDGQQILFPVTTDFDTIVLPIAESVSRYAKSLAAEFPDYQIRSALTRGTLQPTPLGPNGTALWQISSTSAQLQPGEFKNLVK